MRDKCPNCKGDLLLLENSQTIHCMLCGWNTSITNWSEWLTLKTMTKGLVWWLWVIGQCEDNTNVLNAGKFTWQSHLLINALIVMQWGDEMPYVSSKEFAKLEKEATADLTRIESQYEKATWYSRRHAMAFGANEDKLRVAIFEYFRKRDLKLDYHERIVAKRWRWDTLDYW